MAEPLLQVKDLSVSYAVSGRQVKAVNDLTFDLMPGDTLGIVGESGSGKSTLAAALLALLASNGRISGGRILYKGVDLVPLGEDGMRPYRWKEIAMVFQKAMSALSPVHRIKDQFLDVLRIHEPNLSARAGLERCEALAEVVGLRRSSVHAYPHELSGGMLQRIMIALSLVHRPQLLILDEATTALDVLTQAQIIREIKRLQAEFGLTTIVITHDVSVVAELCDRVAVMYAGELMELGAVSHLLTEPAHPYTQAFVRSFPDLDGPKRRIEGIPGSLPDLANLPGGCVFAPRCAHATLECRHTAPPYRLVGDGHGARCHLIGQGGIAHG